MTQPHGVISRPEKVLPFSRPKRVAVVTNNFNQCVKRGKEVRFRDLLRRAAGPDVHVDFLAGCARYGPWIRLHAGVKVTKSPDLSVVVCCYNSADGLRSTLDRLNRQTIRDRLEVIVVEIHPSHRGR